MMENRAAGISEDRALTTDEIECLASLVVDEPDHYTVLGVERGSSASEINTAYCRAVQFFHPLKYSHLLESDNVLHWKLSSAYLRVVEAFSTLSSRSRRQAYDGTFNRQIVGSVRSRQRELSSSDTSQVVSALSGAQRLAANPRLRLNGLERRRVERAPLHLPLSVVFDHHWREITETIDVSPLALKFSLQRQVEPGTLVRLELPMPSDLRTKPDDEVLYTVSAYVIQATPEPGDRVVVAEFV
jgi:hypothetical protein